MMFCPSIQISPTSGAINPTRCLSKTLFPPPLRPIIASVSPVATSRSTPRRISCCPIFLVNARTAIIGEDLLEAKGGLIEGLGDGGASIIATHKPQLSILNFQFITPKLHHVVTPLIDTRLGK